MTLDYFDLLLAHVDVATLANMSPLPKKINEHTPIYEDNLNYSEKCLDEY